MTRLRFTAFLGSVLATTVVLALALGPAFSAIPNPQNKKFYACMKKRTGAMRFINYPKKSTCAKGWKLINWNAKGNPGTAGPPGPAGPAGAAGVAGPAGITRITLTHVFATAPTNIPAGGSNISQVSCPAGKVVGGGADGEPNADIHLVDSFAWDATKWFARGKNTHPTDTRTLQAFAICMTTEPGAVIAKASKFKPAKKGKKKRR